MSNEVVSIHSILDTVKPQFVDIANNEKLVRWEEECQFALQALQGNKGLIECAPHTIQNSIINVAAVGLTLNPSDGYAYLIPEYNTSARQKECVLRVSFKGLIKAATETECIKYAACDVIKENDHYKFKGKTEKPEVEVDVFNDRGKTIGAYCITALPCGDILSDYMMLDEINKAMAAAKTKNVWILWFDEMAKKTMIKRASKQWPKNAKTGRLHKVIANVNETEGSNDIEESARYSESDLAELIPKSDYDKLLSQVKKFKAHYIAIRDNIDAVYLIQTYINNEEWEQAKQEWEALVKWELEDNRCDVQQVLYSVAPTDGGYWSTMERELLHAGFSNDAIDKCLNKLNKD